jgi:hypothetical protein
VLALGDRQYKNFCGFGRALDAWLHAAGARRDFECIEVDNSDPAALAAWQARWGDVAADQEDPADAFAPWRLTRANCSTPAAPVRRSSSWAGAAVGSDASLGFRRPRADRRCERSGAAARLFDRVAARRRRACSCWCARNSIPTARSAPHRACSPRRSRSATPWHCACGHIAPSASTAMKRGR